MGREFSTSKLVGVVAFVCALAVAPTKAQQEWRFGAGTAFTSFSLDGDIGFAAPGPGALVFDVDLDNGDTSDLVESGFGFGGFASRGKWRILYSAGTSTLEDASGSLAAEWERTQLELAGVYEFARTGKHAWGFLFGARHTVHDWQFRTGAVTAEIDEGWTDGLIGLTHGVPFAGRWVWRSRLDFGFGESEGQHRISSAVDLRFARRWSADFTVKRSAVEFGELRDLGESDLYLYDVDETSFGIGVKFHW